MRKFSQAASAIVLIAAFLSVSVFGSSPNQSATAVTEKRTITNIGVFVKFADSDEVVPKRDDETLIHIDDTESIANAERLLNSDELIETELYTHIDSVNTFVGKKSVPSVKKYYETQSYGKLSVKTELFISYEDQHSTGYYRPKSDSNPNGYDDNNKAAREAELVNNAINYVSAQIATTGLTSNILDSDNDGKIDAVALFIEGVDINKFRISQNNLLWSHVNTNKGDITSKIFEREIAAYSIISGFAYTEDGGTFSLKNSGYGAIIHEFGHILKFSDLYRKNSTLSTGLPVHYYDIMGLTTDSNPQNFLAYFTSEYHAETNWHDPLPIVNQTTKNVTVSKPNFIDPSEKRAVKIQKNPTDREYFVVEYYESHDTRDRYSGKSKGIIVYRVNENNRNAGNYNNDTSGKSDHVFIFRPNESTLGAAEGDISHAALNLSRPTLGKTLNSDKTFDNETIYYTDGSNSGIVITVTKETNDSVTFDVNFPDVSGDGTKTNPYLISDTTTFFYSFQNGTAGKYYKLVSDLDFKGLEYPKLNFYGHLDGNNQTLSNVTATDTGIFDSIGSYNQPGSVKNLKVSNLTVSSTTGNSHLGGLATTIDHASIVNVELTSGSVTNVAPSLSFITSTSTGALAGSAIESDIDNCSSAITVASPLNAGGLIGLNQYSQISNSHASGKVNGEANSGAFIGLQYVLKDDNGNPIPYKLPTNSTYDKSTNPTLPTVGGLNLAGKVQTPPNDLLQSITAKTAEETETPTPTPTPEILPTEAEILEKLKLAKEQQYLVGFTLGTDISVLRQTISTINKIQLLHFQSANNSEITSGEIATGQQFTLKIGDTTYNYIVIIKGDVDSDGKIYATDYVRVRNHIMNKTQLSGANLRAADINNDDQIHATDYVKIRNHIMSKSSIEQK